LFCLVGLAAGHSLRLCINSANRKATGTVVWVAIAWCATITGAYLADRQLSDGPATVWSFSATGDEALSTALLSGSITRRNADGLLRAREVGYLRGAAIRRLCIDSPGGDTLGGLLMAWAVNRGNMQVVTRGCASACVSILAASPDAVVVRKANSRYLGHGAVGLHRSTVTAHPRLQDVGKRFLPTIDRMHLQQLRNNGGSEALIRAADDTPPDKMYYPTEGALIAGGLVDCVEEHAAYARYCQ